ncbi:MAG: efflux RND transporter permease subunit [Acidobacteria bacterium]|nr:efflux RND transporter permease subunit [Acidobacteriota bacterium]
MTIAEVCVKRPVFAVMLISFLLVLGIFSFRDLGVDLFPKADFPVVFVQVQLPGATPEEVTTQVVFPLEEALSSVAGLDELHSMADQGMARVVCQFVLEREIESAAQDVREKVAAAMRNLPTNIQTPIIRKADPDSEPVLSLVVGGAGNLRQTTEIADKTIRRALETVNGVGSVTLSGGRLRQIRIFADAERLTAYDLTINQLERAIRNQNVEVPGGIIRRGESEVGVRTLGRIESVSQFENIVVANVGGALIRVKDIGRVEDSYPDPTTWNLLHGKEAVVLSIQRQSGTNTLDVIETAKQKIEQIKPTLPPGIQIEVIRDNSRFIKASVASLEEHLLFGSILASLVVLLFMRNWRLVLIASLAIPSSIVATFTIIKFMGFTLNNMTLLGLTLAVGIVIDDAIVVLENIVRYVEEKDYEPKQAAIAATKEIMLAVMATTLSLVIIFVPIAFITGYARRFLNEFGWTMAFSVMVSLLVSLTLTPMLCSRLLKRPPARGPHHTTKDLGFFHWIDRTYGRMLAWALDHRGTTLLIAAGCFALTFPLNSRVGRDFIPADDQSELNVFFNMPAGMSIEGSERVAREMAEKIEKIRGVEFVWPSIGGWGRDGKLYVRLIDASRRKYTNLDVAAEIRQVLSLPQFRDQQTRVVAPAPIGGGPNFGAIRALVLGPDLHRVAGIAEQVTNEARQIKGLVDVSADINLNSPELQINIDRQRAADLGVQAADVGSAVRLMISGTDQISTYKEGDEQYDVTLQLLPEQQRNPDVLARVMVPSAKLGQVRLDNIAVIQRGVGPNSIHRFNRQFRVSVNANTEADFPLDAAVRAMRQSVENVVPPGYSVRFTGAIRSLDQTTQSLIIAFLLAAIFMYMVLAAQFESFLHPLTIMLALPLAIPFALLTLWLTNRTLNLWSALGVFLLLGIVKKNGILQVDYTNKLRAQGVPLRDAILEANHVRLRPILMTTLSIVAGLIPTALGIGAGAAQRSAIGVTIIGGQSLCLVLTLLVTPVVYSIFAEMEQSRVRAPLQALLTKLRLTVARAFTTTVR